MLEYILYRCEQLRRDMLKPAIEHPMIIGLIKVLPDVGAPFPERKRKIWLETAEAMFHVLYDE